jgi:hypothetical protein
MAVFPFIDGQAGSWGDVIMPEVRGQLIPALARLHLATAKAGSGIATRPF